MGNISKTSANKLQRLQNSALRISTGCVKTSAVDHLHAETQILPVRNHLSLLCSQFLARTLIPSHPITSSSSGPRPIRKTLQSHSLPMVAPYLTNGVLLPSDYKPTIASLHTSTVQSTIASQRPNRILQAPAPDISDDETSLPRPYRTALSQLRSGFCSSLNSFLERIGRAPDALCPSCRGSPHTTSHIFSCPSHPTSLTVRDLWDRPCSVAVFLFSLSLSLSSVHPAEDLP